MQIFDIFGTVDLEQLRAIAQKAQLIESEKPHNERGAGRKNSLTPQQSAEMLALHQRKSTASAARRFTSSWNECRSSVMTRTSCCASII